MRICPKCGKENSNNAVHCGKCGAVLIKKENGSKGKSLPIVGIAIAAVLVIGGAFLLTRNNGTGSKEPQESVAVAATEPAEQESGTTPVTTESASEAISETTKEEVSPEEKENPWGDEVLEAKMRKITGNNNDDFKPEDAKYLTELDLSAESRASDNEKIINVGALGKLTNLTYLNLNYNSISNVSALSELKDLKVLVLFDNPVTDIDSLSSSLTITLFFNSGCSSRYLLTVS